jgi:signal transduction histidine kinase
MTDRPRGGPPGGDAGSHAGRSRRGATDAARDGTSGPPVEPRPLADGGAPRPGLFERLPDPLLAYANEPDPDAGARSPVVRRVNPAFEARFEVDDDDVAGAPLDEFELAGAVVDDGDAEADDRGDLADADEAGADEADADEADTDEAEVSDVAATAGSLLDRVRREAGTSVPLRHESGSETRHFRVRAVTATDADAAPDGGAGYLQFVDVTDLERERRDLAGRVARLERLASVARHDLRNPLEVATIRLEAARDSGEDVHFEKVAGALDRVEHIVRDVLAVGGDAVTPTDAVALDAAAEAAWATVDTADAALVVDPGLPTVRGDRDRLRQLFENLFRNCVEHGSTNSRADAGDDEEHGSTGSRSETDDGAVTVTVAPLPDGFVVADDGPGFPREAGERVLDAGYSTAPGNSGLGLSIVDEIARGHGWRVSLGSDRERSVSDGGARVEFTGVERAENGEVSRDPDPEPDGGD